MFFNNHLLFLTSQFRIGTFIKQSDFIDMIKYAEIIMSSIQVSSEPFQLLSSLFMERWESRLIALKWK